MYQFSYEFHIEMKNIIENNILGRSLADQLNRASASIMLNIAEGYGRYQKGDKRSFYVNARGSLFECVSCLDIFYERNIPAALYNKADRLGKMLSGLIKTFS